MNARITIIPVVVLTLGLAGCDAAGNLDARISEAEACDAVKGAVVSTGRFEADVINNCDFGSSDEAPAYYVLRLNAHCREELCGSVLLGWYGVERDTGRVFDWDISYMRPIEEIGS